MTPERLDNLVERALETGTVPSDATPQEIAELEPLLNLARALRLNAARVDTEASAAMPTARARFQRYLAAQRPPAVAQVPGAVVEPRRQGRLGGLFAGRRLALGAMTAAIGLAVVLALVIIQPFSNVQTASALTIDDYVQVQGVVARIDGNTVTVQSSELGNLEVALSDLTSVTDESSAREASSLKPGEPVVVGGIVTAKRAIAASAVAVARPQTAPAPVANANVPVLKRFREGLEGTIRLVSLAPDGRKARVLVVLPSESFWVDVDRGSVDSLLASNPTILGARVRILSGPEGVFRLQALNQPADPTAAGQPQFPTIRGVVVSRTARAIRVHTDRGDVEVLIRDLTSLRFSNSGLTPADVRQGEGIIGHEVVVSFNPDSKTPRVIVAEIFVVLPKPAGGTK